VASGHVVANNDVRHCHDGFDVATYGAPEKDEGPLPESMVTLRKQ
jgi:hypothetical protein